MRVIFLEPTVKDTVNAKDFGELVYLWGDTERRPASFSDRLSRELSQRLSDIAYTPDDYIVITGDQVGVIRLILAASTYGPIKTLCFNAPTAKYRPLVLGGLHAGSV